MHPESAPLWLGPVESFENHASNKSVDWIIFIHLHIFIQLQLHQQSFFMAYPICSNKEKNAFNHNFLNHCANSRIVQLVCNKTSPVLQANRASLGSALCHSGITEIRTDCCQCKIHHVVYNSQNIRQKDSAKLEKNYQWRLCSLPCSI